MDKQVHVLAADCSSSAPAIEDVLKDVLELRELFGHQEMAVT